MRNLLVCRELQINESQLDILTPSTAKLVTQFCCSGTGTEYRLLACCGTNNILYVPFARQ